MIKTHFAILLLCVFSISVLGNRKPVLHHYTTEDGLFHNEIRLIRKAENGMLWLGTQNGLSSFDGYRFNVYKYDSNNPNSICSDKIYALETSSTGLVWVGTTIGLCALNPLTGSSEAFPDTFDIETQLSTSFINTLLEDRSGYLWISCNTGNYRYSVNHNTMEEILPKKHVKSYYEGREGIFWVCHGRVVSKYDRKTDKILVSYPYNISKLYTDRFGVLWGVGDNGLYRYMPGKSDFEWVSHVKSSLRSGFDSIGEDKDGRLLLGVYAGGVTIYDPKNNEVSHLIAYPEEQYALSSNDVYDIFSDESGVVLIGTQEGLDVYDWSRQRFLKWNHSPDNPDGLSNSFIQYIYRDQKKQLWLGTRDNGLERLKSDANIVAPSFEHFPPGNAYGELSGNYITGILEDSKDRFWVASWGGGLNLKESGSDQWINFRNNKNDESSISNNGVISILEDRRGRIWVGTLGGLNRLVSDDEGEYSFKNFKHIPDDSLSISRNGIFKVFEDSKGRIWLAVTEGGLNLIQEEAEGKVWFKHFRHDPKNPRSISNDEVYIIFEDSKHRLWVGTSLKGFNRVFEEVDSDGKSKFWFKSYQEQDGLSDNEVNAILEDDFGYLWISTNSGISKFDPESETFVSYAEYDGVLKGKFRKNAAWKDEDGTMFFGGVAGVNIFNPTHFEKNEIPPNPIITGVIIDGKQYFENDSLEGKLLFNRDDSGDLVLNLPAEFNRFKLQFSAMSYSSSRRNQYQWKLNGFDADWQQYEGAEPELIYNALESREYDLQIKAANNDGVWGNLPVRMRVNISSDGKNKTAIAFGALVLIIFVLGIVALVQKKAKNITKKKAPVFATDADKKLIVQLNLVMEEKKLYLDSKIGLNDLADEINITPNQLSALLNDAIGKPFYDYVNEFRIEEVKRRLVDPNQKKQTILAIAWDCGFNSKSAFNRVFKINTGNTPSEFQKKHLS